MQEFKKTKERTCNRSNNKMISKLTELEQESIKRGIPIIGREKGKWLLEKVKETKPEKILELGTANGYSGTILGSEGAEVITLELDEKIAEEAAVTFTKFNTNAKIIIGDGVELVKELADNKESFDMIFIDFSKSNYIKVLENCLKLVKKGGFIIADNITFKNCQDYKKAVLNHHNLNTEIIDIKDGLSCSMKIK